MIDERLFSSMKHNLTATTAALVLMVSRPNYNAADVPQPPVIPADSTHQAFWTTDHSYESSDKPLPIIRASGKNAPGVELSELGKKLLALRKRAIEAGMPTYSSEEIMARYREQREE